MNNTVLITNASDKIGKATAIVFAEQGWNVAATMPLPEKGRDLLKYKNIKIYELSFKEKNFNDILESILIDFSKLHAVLYNVNMEQINLFENMQMEMIEELFNKNVFGFMKLTKVILPYFRAQKAGKIVMILPTKNADSLPFHVVQKSFIHAIQGFCQSLAEEVHSFGIELNLFELPLLQSDFYQKIELDNEVTKNYQDYYSPNAERLREFLEKSDSISEIPRQIFSFIQTKKTVFTDDFSYRKPPKKQKISEFLSHKIQDTIQKIGKKK
jgi:NAD(P)-dependent dehydrogenase (short-subunit alcohol dehydrogenase family)